MDQHNHMKVPPHWKQSASVCSTHRKVTDFHLHLTLDHVIQHISMAHVITEDLDYLPIICSYIAVVV